MPPVIKVSNLSKQYRLGQVGTGTISHDVNRWWHKVRGKEDPYLKIGESNDRTVKGESDYVWALKDINFEVQQGEVLGIIGRNGAGKSTLLKILSRTTSPTTGSVKLKGRVASLLEVGTGFHPELSGRDNIYLNGAILGMTRHEIKRKFDEIVDFAGVERYIDTPVKRYSSGMYVRLAFGVAAHLESEILIVDEVLAVGDAEFQKKCLGKMKEVSEGQGRTVLFVSHNIASVNSLCTQVLILKNGCIDLSGNTKESISYFIKSSSSVDLNPVFINQNIRFDSGILNANILNKQGQLSSIFKFNETIRVQFKIQVAEQHLNAFLGFRIKDQLERIIFTSEIEINSLQEIEGTFEVYVEIPGSSLVPNNYTISAGIHIPNVKIIQYIEAIIHFTIEETGSRFSKYIDTDYGCVVVDCNWGQV